MSPTLTIAIPVYERVTYFEETLSSALDVQGCSEILVVDDGSTHDEFERICRSKNDPRIRFERNSTNVGLFGNWNRCAELARSEFVAILCSDDIIAADVYKRFLEAYRQAPDLDVFFGSFVMLDSSTGNVREVRSFSPGPMTSKELLEDVAENGPGFPVLSVIRREKILRFPFVAKPHSGNDWLWIYSHATELNLYADTKPLVYWRRHADQDAKRSEAITTDCWPLMYRNLSLQLEKLNSRKVRKAKRRAEGVVLTWLLNDRQKRGWWHSRLNGKEAGENVFLSTAKEIADRNWLLHKLLTAESTWPLYYHVGRALRKAKVYPPLF